MCLQACKWLLSIVVAGILTCGSAALSAPAADVEANRKQAMPLVDDGVNRFQREDYQGALDRFEEAYRIFPSRKILVNIGGALRKLGREVEAAEVYERFLEAAAQEPAASKIESESLGARLERNWHSTESRVAAILVDLRKRIGRLHLSVQPTSVRVVIDGQVVRLPKDRPLYVYPGMHRLEVAAKGYRSQSLLSGVAAGQERTLEIILKPETTGPGAQEPFAQDHDAAGRSRTWTWVTAGTALALLAGGVAVSLHANSVYDDYKAASARGDLALGEDRFSQAQSESTIATVLYVGGGAAAVGAVLLYFFEGRHSSSSVAHMGPGPMGTAGLSLGGRF